MTGVQLRAVVESRGVDFEFDVSAGEVLAVLGPNGAGKSTALHLIAGLVRPDRGEVRVGQRVLTDTAAGVHVATHDRRVGLLLQEPLLFPHLNVTGNVAFAPRSSRAAAAHWSRATARHCLAGGAGYSMPSVRTARRCFAGPKSSRSRATSSDRPP